jgi:hypothetical protein
MKLKRILPLLLLHTLTVSLVRVICVFAAVRRFGRFTAVLFLLILPLFFLTRVGTHVPTAYAATSDNLNFQARLQTSSGAIVPDGYYNVEFKLYDALTSGTLLWTETRIDSNGVTAGNDNRVRVVNGYLTVNLGDKTSFPTDMPWDQQLYLTMNIGGTTHVSNPTFDGEMSPRLKMTAVPYAFNAKTASQLITTNGALTSSLSIQAPTIGDQIFEIPDQGAAGTYTLLTGAAANGSYIQLQGSTPGTAQTGNFNISGTGIAGVLQASTSISTVDFTATGQSILGGDNDEIQVIVKADAVQTANILEFQTSTGVTLSSFDANGQLTLGRIAASGATQAGNLTFADGTTSNFGASIGTETLTADRKFILPNTTLATTASPATICVYNGAVSNCPAATGSAYYIQNQSAGAQSSATFWIDGVARADGGMTGPSFDTASAGALSIGTTNATQINLNQDVAIAANQNVTFAAGTGTFDQSASSGIFSTGTGAVSLNGDTTVASGENFTVTSGTTSLTGTTNINTTGTDTTSIGSVTGGAVNITANAASNFTTNTGALTLTSAAATTWSTTAGALTLQGADGATIRTTDGTTTSAVTITTGNASAGASGAISIDTGTATTTAGTISIGTSNASAVTIGRATVTTTIQGSLSINPQASTSTTLLCTNAGVVSICDTTVLAPTGTNFIQNQNASQQTGNYWISGTARADTSMLSPLLDTATAVALNIGTTNATSINIGRAAISTTLASSTITFGTTGSSTTLQGATQTTADSAGDALTLQSSTGNGTGSGGILTIKGGTGGATNANGGNVVISGGSATGAGTQGLVTFSTSAFLSSSTQSFGSSGSLTAGLVDQYSSVPVSATTTGVTVTIPAPAVINQIVGRVLYLANVGSDDFNILLSGTSINISLKPNSTATLIWNGLGWTAAGASSSTDLQSAYTTR